MAWEDSQARRVPSIVLSTPDTVKFINLYQQQEVLWNINYPNHSHRLFRQQAIQAISKGMGNNWTEQQVKDKILSLRSRYSKEIVKVRVSISSGVEHVYTPVWRFFPLLDSFLRPFCVTRKTDTPVVRAFHQKLMEGRVQSGAEQSLSSPLAYDQLPHSGQQYQDVSSTKGYPAVRGMQMNDEVDDDDDLQIIESFAGEDSMDQTSHDSGQTGNEDVDNSLSLSDLVTTHSESGDKKGGDICNYIQKHETYHVTSADDQPVHASAHLAHSDRVSKTSNASQRSYDSGKGDTLFYGQSGNHQVMQDSLTSKRGFELADRKSPAKRMRSAAPPSPPAPPLPSRNPSSVNEESESQTLPALEVESGGDALEHHGRNTYGTSPNISNLASQMLSAMQKLIANMSEKTLKSESMDSDSAFANHIAFELRKLDEDLKIDVKFNIQQALYEAQKQMRARRQSEAEKVVI